MVSNNVQLMRDCGQSVWYDNISRGLIESGGLQGLIDLGVSGLTSNPTIFEQAVTGSSDYDNALLELARRGKTAEEIYETLAINDIRSAADLLEPIYDGSDGADGYASLEVSPYLAHDTEETVAEAKRLFKALDRPNVMMKVPATPQGIPAVHRLIGEGINVNVTLTFSLESYRDVRQGYLAGLEDLHWSGGELASISSVASFFISRVDTAVDSLIDEIIHQGNEKAQDLKGKAAISNAKLAYRDFAEDFQGDRFAILRDAGARVQRPLWASTSTKNPDYSDVLYVESLVGPDTVNTMPDGTLQALMDHAEVTDVLEQELEAAQEHIETLEDLGISMEDVTAKLLSDGVNAFANSYTGLKSNIEEKRVKLLTGRE